MPTSYDVPINDLINKTAEELKSLPEIKAPEWAAYVKTGVHKERPPAQKNWWQIRAAAILCSVQNLGPVGVAKLRTKYGGRKNRGHQPEEFRKGSGNIIRKILQQLEKAGFIKHVTRSGHKGRIITPKGTALLARVSATLVPTKDSQKQSKKNG